MFKYLIYLIALTIIVGGVAGAFHLYRVNQKNKTEMAKFADKVQYKNNLGKVLVVYYSLSGQTRKIAEYIAAQTNADTYEITVTEPYASPSVYAKSKKELDSKQYPPLATEIPDLSAYDVIFVGGPVWWYTMATPLFSFLQKADFAGKKVVPFSTQGSNYGKFFADFADTAKNADIQKSENFNNLKPEYDEMVHNKINTWLNDLTETITADE
ncbi:MAG: NAD(P)H-dependent oxidoreductase [Alphaproteobacteria bacterium]|nr:NAD(P)H-dependent oxidoreductase [Alphaproteobacteria bacterium]